MVDIKSELSANQTVLLLMETVGYNDIMGEVMKNLSGKSICYVTSNKTYDSLKETFQKNKINTDNVVFIDAISKSLKKVPDSSDGVYYVSNPGALTELDIVIGKFLRHEFDYLIFDSLTNLITYSKQGSVSKFVKSLIEKVKKGKTSAVFYCMQIKEHEPLIKQTSMAVDKVLKV